MLNQLSFYYYTHPLVSKGNISSRYINPYHWSKRGGSGISWTICKSFAPHARQITMPVPHHSSFYRLDALPATQPTASKHWRHWCHSTEHIQFPFSLPL